LRWFLWFLIAAHAPSGIALIPPSERLALLDLFAATEGERWTDKEGWRGAPGTECSWHGVICSTTTKGDSYVEGLELSDNNLSGSLPPSLVLLSSLRELYLFGNPVKGRIPDAWLTLWDRNQFQLEVNAENFENLDYRATLRVSNGSVLCDFDADPPHDPSNYLLRFTAGGRATRYVVACAGRRKTQCIVYDGLVRGVARVGRLAAFLDFEDEPDETWSVGTTHASFYETAICLGSDCRRASTYGRASSLSTFAVEQAVLGLAAEVEWKRVRKQPHCPTE
jgi:Leucine Rich Repeat